MYRSCLNFAFRILPFTLLLATLGCHGDSELQPAYEAWDPESPGPFSVGVRTVLLVDESRYDITTKSGRQLLTEVWYPAAESAADMPTYPIKSFFGEWQDFVLTVFRAIFTVIGAPEEIDNFSKVTGAVRDAPMARDRGPFPLVLFSHGNIGIRFQSYTLMEYLASHGYIVASPDHTGNAFVTALPDRLVIVNPLLIPLSLFDRPMDLIFLADRFREISRGSGSFLRGMIDEENVAVTGHSFGGLAAVIAVTADPELKAAISYAGPWLPFFPEGFSTPILYMLGHEDRTLGELQNAQLRLTYAGTPSTKFMVELYKAGHYTFTNACGLAPSLFGSGDGCDTGHYFCDGSPFEYISAEEGYEIINAYTTAFLGYTLKGLTEYLDYLTSEHFPGRLAYSFRIAE